MAEQAALFVGPSWVGDMVMAQSAFRLYKEANPDVAIDIIAPGWSLPIVDRMPEVRRAHALDTAHGEFGWGKRRALGNQLKAENYTHAIILPRSFKSALVPWMAGIPKRTGFRGESRFGLINDVKPFDRSILDQTVKRFAVLATDEDVPPASLPQPRLRVSEEAQQRLVESLNLRRDLPAVAMMPGAEYGPAKCWPLDYYTELAAGLIERGRTVWVLGSKKDRPAGEAIATAHPEVRNLCGETSLVDAVDVLGMAETAVSNDSGLMHVAAAVGCHVHGIYGSSSPAFTPPLTDRRNIHYLDLDCSPCFERECPLGHLNCLKNIQPRDILSVIASK